MYDLIIIGGGINGVGIANQAVSCGLKVLLCEQNDLASGTSFASSKLIHGGLRYLEFFHFGLVRKALKEREVLLHKAPHLVKPMSFILPQNSSMRASWVIGLGLFLYDRLSPKRYLMPSQKIDLTLEPILLPQFTTGFRYADCVTDDARLVITNTIAAFEQGCDILTRTSFVKAKRFANNWEITLKDNITGNERFEQAKMLINTAGAWVDEVSKQIDSHKKNNRIQKIKGSHVVFPKLYEGNQAFILQNTDKRVIFVIPFQQHFHLVGTTEVDYQGSLDQVQVTGQERQYLCDCVNRYFAKSVHVKDIIWEYAGVRALTQDKRSDARETSREYLFNLDKKLAPLLTVLGGKLTTFRVLAEEAWNLIKDFFPQAGASSTKDTLLPGGDIGSSGFDQFCYAAKKQFSWLPKETVERMANAYGSRLYQILYDKQGLSDLGEHFGHGLYQTEVDYLCQYEWAKTSEDILWRRSKLGLFFKPEEVEKLQEYVNSLLLDGFPRRGNP